jgi:hypothetical protein
LILIRCGNEIQLPRSRHIFKTQGCAINTKAANKSKRSDNASKYVTTISTPYLLILGGDYEDYGLLGCDAA